MIARFDPQRMKHHFSLTHAKPLTLAVEFCLLFIVLPLLLLMMPVRGLIAPVLWCATFYAITLLSRDQTRSWGQIWRGPVDKPLWNKRAKQVALLRFIGASIATFAATWFIAPTMLFAFPLQKPIWWLAVMALYPLFSALPQEILFRVFFFRRYEKLFGLGSAMPIVSALCFGLAHILFQNWQAPLLSALCGWFWGSAYRRHGSLKWAAFEHAAYGCMVFTIGLGRLYFVLGWHSP